MLKVDFNNTERYIQSSKDPWRGGEKAKMNKKEYTVISLFFLTLIVVSATIFTAKGAFQIYFTPSFATPGDPVSVAGSMQGDYEPLVTMGIGFGPEVEVTKEAVTVTATGTTSAEGYTANTPVKPGSFRWSAPYGGITVEVFDVGNGTLDDYFGWLSSGTINYTSGYFSRTIQMGLSFGTTNNFVNYTTYENNVTPAAGITTTASGSFLEIITVPQVPNGTYTVTAIDELGNVGTGTFQVAGSDIIPEPLTVGTIVLLSSTAMLVSFYWLRKRILPKI